MRVSMLLAVVAVVGLLPTAVEGACERLRITGGSTGINQYFFPGTWEHRTVHCGRPLYRRQMSGADENYLYYHSINKQWYFGQLAVDCTATFINGLFGMIQHDVEEPYATVQNSWPVTGLSQVDGAYTFAADPALTLVCEQWASTSAPETSPPETQAPNTAAPNTPEPQPETAAPNTPEPATPTSAPETTQPQQEAEPQAEPQSTPQPETPQPETSQPETPQPQPQPQPEPEPQPQPEPQPEPEAPVTNQLSATLKQEFVDIHNEKRRNAGNLKYDGVLIRDGMEKDPPGMNMYKVEWEESLGVFAQKMANTCKFGHSANDARKDKIGTAAGTWSFVGENIAWRSAGYNEVEGDEAARKSLTSAMSGWVESEAIHYNHDTKECTPGKQCGHYTQVMWAATYRIGCAVKYCEHTEGVGAPGFLTFCNYGHGGNCGMNGQGYFPYDTMEAGQTVLTDAPFNAPNTKCSWHNKGLAGKEEADAGSTGGAAGSGVTVVLVVIGAVGVLVGAAVGVAVGKRASNKKKAATLKAKQVDNNSLLTANYEEELL